MIAFVTANSKAAKFLLVDTCGGRGMVALADGDDVLTEVAMPGRTYSERLVAEGMRLLGEAGWKLAELDAIAVVTGPGSFTGVRVGLSAVKGWSEAAGVPVIGISRLELLTVGGACAALDAGRGEFYFGARGEDGIWRESLRTREEMLGVEGGVIVCEAGVAEALGEVVMMMAEPGAREVLRRARERFAAGEFADVATLDANYVRRSDAEIFAKPAAKRVVEGAS